MERFKLSAGDCALQPERLQNLWRRCLGPLFAALCIIAIVALNAAARPQWRGEISPLFHWRHPHQQYHHAACGLAATGTAAARLPYAPATANLGNWQSALANLAAAAAQGGSDNAHVGAASPAGGACTLRLPWQPMLRQQDVQRGLAYYGTASRLRRVAAKLLAGQPIKAITVGGSVTQGVGASEPRFSYAGRFFEFLNATFPHRQHEFINRGVGATSSSIFASCFQRMVAEDADLVVLELTVNEVEDVPYSTPDRRGYEQLLRRMLDLPTRPAIIQLHHHRWWTVDKNDTVSAGVFFMPPAEAQLTVFAHYYDFPVVSVRAAVYPLMQAGIKGFKADKVPSTGLLPTYNHRIPTAEPQHASDYFYSDKTHPTDGGHKVLAELLVSVVLRATMEADGPLTASAVAGLDAWQPGSQLAMGGAAPEATGRLPPAMIPGNSDVTTSLCALQEDFKAAVVASSGFRYVPERPYAPTFVAQKWAWTGRQPGAWAELEFDSQRYSVITTKTGKHNGTTYEEAAQEGSDGGGDEDRAGENWSSGEGGESEGGEEGEQAWVYLVFLRSYAGGMGTAEVTCLSGCRCFKSGFDGTWTRQVSLQQMHKVAVTQHAKCRMRVQVSSQPGEAPQDGHKVSLMGLLVSHFRVKASTDMAAVQGQG